MYIVAVCRYYIRRNASLDALLIVIGCKIKMPCIWVPNEYKYSTAAPGIESKYSFGTPSMNSSYSLWIPDV